MNFDWVEYGSTGASWLRLSIPYRKQFGRVVNSGLWVTQRQLMLTIPVYFSGAAVR